MKKLTLGLLMCCAALLAVAAEQSAWTTDLPAAQAKAKADHKLVVMDFTGSDWCPWCIKLRNEIFNTAEFKGYASTNLVLVEVDFPREKPQSDALKAANDALQKKYGIEGYPTVIVLDSNGNKVGQLGYQRGGPKPFIEALDKLKK